MNKLSRATIVSVVLTVMSLIIFGNYQHASGDPPLANFIRGNVHVMHGSPAGVWVIAETDELLTNETPTGDIIPGKFRKIVVTNEQGKFLIPDLPQGNYKVWVRGYGLKDSNPVILSPSTNSQNLNAHLASTPQEAAEVYPGHYWFSLMEFPDDISAVSNFPNNGAWASTLKLSCELCHQQGSEPTRDEDSEAEYDEAFKTSGGMNGVNGWPRAFALDRYADWGGRIAAGEVPPQPPRPQGIERNIVITQYEWGDVFTYAHDQIATDKRNPQLYPYGKVYGVDLGNDWLVMTDPVSLESTRVKIPTVGGYDTPWSFCTLGCLGSGANAGGTPSFPAYVGVYHNPANPHNPMMDDEGRVWMTTQIRDDSDDPDYCPDINPDPTQPGGTGHRQLGFYDTNRGEMFLIDTCTGTHHLQFDSNDVLWLSGDSQYFGWFDTNTFDSVYDPDTWDNDLDSRGPAVEAATDFERMRVDDDCVEATPPVNVNGFNYGIIANLPDGSVWSASPSSPGEIRRFDPTTRTFEVYDAPGLGGPRGIDADTDGHVWTCLSVASQVAMFDRSKCAQTCGSGGQCPEGWTTWDIPGPVFQNTDIKSDNHYYAWVDQQNTLGLGENEVFCTGTGSDSLIGFNPQTEQFTRITIPYPLNAYMRGLDGRIDDPDAGWKGRGLWADYGGDPTIHVETQQGQIYQVQLRNSPLDK
jgi:hypothetical protein